MSRTVLDTAETVSGAVAALVDAHPDFAALTFLDREWREQRVTLGQLWRRAREIQATMVARGLRPRDEVLLALPTSLELAAAYLGAMLAGAVPALVATPFHRFADPRVYTHLLASILGVARPAVLYCAEQVAALCRENAALALPGTALLTPVRGNAAGEPPPVVAARPEAVAMVQYTSGSTGRSKGVVLSHRAMLNNMRATRDGLGAYADDVSVNWAPLYHDMGLIDTYLRPLLSGSPTVLIPTADFLREPTLWLWAIHHFRAAVSWAPNFAYALCAKRLSDEELDGLDLSSWRVAVNASEPCLADTIESFAGRFARYGYRPEAMTPAWGVAEAVCIATAEPVDEPPRIETIDRRALATENVARPTSGEGLRSVSVGRCLPRCEVEIRDEGGRALGERAVGKIWLRTRSLFEGYLRDPELTGRILMNGWVDTGDRGYVADGRLFFVSRDKDLIVIGGEKYAPHDVEGAIGHVVGVREGCAVAFGVLNEERGTEEVAAVVETRETAGPELERLRDTIRREVTRVTGLALRYVILVPPGSIQKTTSGKLARGATRERHLAQLLSS